MATFTIDPYNINKPMKFVEEAGNYNVEILNTKYTERNGSGNEMITFDLKIMDGDYEGSLIKYNNISLSQESQDKRAASIKRFNSLAVAMGGTKNTTISIEQLSSKMNGAHINVFANWDDPDKKGNIYLKARQYYVTDPEGSKPNGIKKPINEQSNNGFDQSTNNGLNASAGNNSFTNNKGANYNGGQPFDNVPDGMPF
ncbi:DUF669 domain-containing protein [Lactiplantibacillus argentoratensis]|nr:DUF669 domain-containing protein [Lactiplantibacillus argentoratensis]MDK9681624.1 DUF669 domain-containing protein [Lactiplantibacillus argentoratensis]